MVQLQRVGHCLGRVTEKNLCPSSSADHLILHYKSSRSAPVPECDGNWTGSLYETAGANVLMECGGGGGEKVTQCRSLLQDQIILVVVVVV